MLVIVQILFLISIITYLLPCFVVYLKFKHISFLFISLSFVGFIHFLLNTAFGLFRSYSEVDSSILITFLGVDILSNIINILLFVVGFNYLSKLNLPSLSLNLKYGYKTFLLILFFIGILQMPLIAMLNGDITLIFDPRLLYQYGRSGFGLFYALGISFYSLFLFFFMLKSRSLKNIILIIIPTLFFGSKGFFIYSTMYVFILHIFIHKRFSKGLFIILSIMLIIGIYILFSKNFNILGLVNYFNISYVSIIFFQDFFSNKFISFDFQGLSTEYYKYFPSFFFPDRPVIRGHLFLVDHYFPGAVEMGHTPAFTQFSYYLSDGGILYAFFRSVLNVGPLISGFAIYNALRFYKDKPFPLVPILPLIFAIFYFSPQFGKFIPTVYSFIILTIILSPSIFKICFTKS